MVSSLHAHAKTTELAPRALTPGSLPSDPYVTTAYARPDQPSPALSGEAASIVRPGASPSASPSPAPSSDDPAGAAALNSRADAAWQAGRTSDALDSWARAAQADPTGPAGSEARRAAVGHYQAMAQDAAARGDTAQARTDWQKITEIDPGSDDALQAVQSISRTEPSSASAAPDPLTPGVGMPR